MEICPLSQFQWLKQNCINICCNTCGLLISSSCLLCGLISKQSFINQPVEKWHDWEDWWCLKVHFRITIQIYLFDRYLTSHCVKQRSMSRREKQTQYFLHSAFRSYIITWIHFCRKDYSKCLLKNKCSSLSLYLVNYFLKILFLF